MSKHLRNREAVLVFAREIGLDLRRRRWGKSFRRLLRIPRFLAQVDADLHIFTSRKGLTGCRSRFPEAEVHLQKGQCFGEALERAVRELSDRGYRRIVVVGRDCPGLTRSDVEAALAQLQENSLVLGPDHRGGLYLIGIHDSQIGLLSGVRWQEDSDFADLAGRAPTDQVHILPVRQDLDTSEDLLLLSRGNSLLARLVRRLLKELSPPEPRTPPPPAVRLRRTEVLLWQLPPPCRPSV